MFGFHRSQPMNEAQIPLDAGFEGIPLGEVLGRQLLT